MDDQWRLIEQCYVEICEQVLGRADANRKETWEGIEQRKVAKKHHEHDQNEKAEER